MDRDRLSVELLKSLLEQADKAATYNDRIAESTLIGKAYALAPYDDELGAFIYIFWTTGFLFTALSLRLACAAAHSPY